MMSNVVVSLYGSCPFLLGLAKWFCMTAAVDNFHPPPPSAIWQESGNCSLCQSIPYVKSDMINQIRAISLQFSLGRTKLV
eukprot:645534-Amphidinium_carterae.1